ncbi:putative DNA 3'-phosphatase Tpp1 [Aspergillus ruber CBS 135680]|uniref:Polynucleotide kinase n=1 Tax=Aspergillus ruber (strain CBS 135680) TaxID=1388766 RepID=A0A017SRM3_ASPRC|nr:polynucleotide kinase [Aspergillus ruber CBS 135680]EYE99471.1 polynucleotide kinase [Aspergillus ruber CBS 135680]
MAGTSAAKRAASPSRAISPPPLKRTAAATTKTKTTVTKKSAANFFTPVSQKKPDSLAWRIVNNTLIIGKYSGQQQEPSAEKKQKIAAFDLDSTLITSASGATFARSPKDWKWWDASVPSRVRELNSEGYQVVVVSNQKQISLKKGAAESKSYSNFKEKVTAVLNDLDVPLSVYAATETDEYRKPRLGMWREFLEDYDLDVEGVDLKSSFFVGDAAGRRGDHSLVDRGFAVNIGVDFKTPEEFFLNQAPEAFEKPFDPASYLHTGEQDLPLFTRLHPLELVIFCGSPGAGKSTFYWNNLESLGYERVNQDILKSRPKCLKVAREHLIDGKSVAVDNTNADPETRAHWTALAKDLKIPIRCVLFLTSPELCKHNNAARAVNRTLNPESRTSLPGIAFGDFGRRFKEPSLDEGFSDIIRVKFRFHGRDEEKRLWSQYYY